MNEKTNRVLTINNASARTKGNYFDVSKERYYYIYPAPPKPQRAEVKDVINKIASLFDRIF